MQLSHSDHVPVVAERRLLLAGQRERLEGGPVLAVRDIDAVVETLHDEITNETRPRPRPRHVDARDAFSVARADGDVPQRADVVRDPIQTDGARVVLPRIDDQVPDVLLEGVVAGGRA